MSSCKKIDQKFISANQKKVQIPGGLNGAVVIVANISPKVLGLIPG
jgi:hypothetical protein